MISKAEIKNRVLTDNTAQGVLNHLRELESNRARMQRRWIWELLQNARDASHEDDTHLVASVELCSGELVFQHNGRGFTMEEVAHLIYHGSTKLEDEETIGQYGSGFLTTHLLSPTIDVSGQLDDKRPFEFRLKREITSAKALSNSMDRAWDQFDASTEAVADSYTTRFRYPLEEEATGAVEEGIKTLKQCAPFVVVFNRQFRSINIQSPDEATTFEVVERVTLAEGLYSVRVGVTEQGALRVQQYLLAEGTQASVTIRIESTDDGVECLALQDIPRLFLGFPLVGTETFSFPAIINSFAFTPTENRDGVYLGQSNDEANQNNQAAIEEAFDLHTKLIKFVAESRWANVHTLANIPTITEQRWLSREWLNDRLRQLVSQVRQTPAVLSGDAALLPKDSIVPLATEDINTEALWDLLSQVKALQQKLPARNEANGWRVAVESWAQIADYDATSFGEGFDSSKLVSYVEEATKHSSNSNIATLEQVVDVDAVAWLDRFYQFLKDENTENLIRERNIVLNQAGYLGKLVNLHRDNEIDEELKAIGDDVLDLRFRVRLRDVRLTSLANEPGKGDLGNNEVSRAVADKLQELSNEDDIGIQFAHASPRFLTWLVTNKQLGSLTGFPAFSKRSNIGNRAVLWLGQKGNINADIPLAPINAWAKDLQPFADIFPWRYILAEDYFAAMPQTDVWRMLSEEGYVRTDVVVNSNNTISDFLPDEPLPEDEHITVEDITQTEIAFLTRTRERVGIMARLRDSQARARLFWRFLTEWLITHDSEGLEPQSANCKCGVSHRYYPARWLVPVVRNIWVPQGNDIHDRATAQSLAKLLRGSGWTPNALSDNPTALKFLEAIRVTRFDLVRHFAASDEESQSALDEDLTKILVATDGDLSHVKAFMEDMKTDKDFLKHLEERRKTRRDVHENQRIGSLVEDLVKDGLEDEGFTVKPTGIGSDFEIEYDRIEGDQEVGIELSRNGRTWLVEVKSTREQRVRMTTKQAETAVEKGDGFLLCVVPVGNDGTNLEKEEVRANMRFVQNIGPLVEPQCTKLDLLNNVRDFATAPSDDDIRLEIEGGTARISVNDAVWQDGICLSDLSTKLM